MKKQLLSTFKDFHQKLESKKVEEAAGMASRKLIKATDEYHEAQLKLQELQNEFVKTTKEDTSKREQLKKAIIDQNKIVKQKEAIFQKALGDEDIDDLEI
jgi:hypothetical protein